MEVHAQDWLTLALSAFFCVVGILFFLDGRGERKANADAIKVVDRRVDLVRTDHDALAGRVTTIGACVDRHDTTIKRLLVALPEDARLTVPAPVAPPAAPPARPPPAAPPPPAPPARVAIETAPDSDTGDREAFADTTDLDGGESRDEIRARVEAEQDAREKARDARPGVALAAALVAENPVDDDDPPTVVPTGDADDGDRASDGLTKVTHKPAAAWLEACVSLRNDIARRGAGAQPTEDERKLLKLWSDRAKEALDGARNAPPKRKPPHPLADVKPEEPTSSATRAAADFAAREGKRLESPTKASAGEPSVEDRITRRYAVLLNDAEDAGEDVAHCKGALCWHDKGEPTPDACACDCDPCERAKGLYCQARREIAGESLPPPRKA